MTINIGFRAMQIADLDDVHRLESKIFPTPWSLKSYRFEIESNHVSDPWVAFIEESSPVRIIGYIVAWMLVNEVHIANIAVDPVFRKKGIGRRLLKGALLRAVKVGITTAILEVRSSNLTAQKLYRSFNFEIVGQYKHYYKDNGEDAIIMRMDALINNKFLLKHLEAA